MLTAEISKSLPGMTIDVKFAFDRGILVLSVRLAQGKLQS